jgi:hypothetical protein
VSGKESAGGKSDPAAIARLTQDAIALASRLPGQPSRIRLRDGSCEVEIEWEPRRALHSVLDGQDESGYRSGKHRRATDSPPDGLPFSLKLAGQGI